MNEINLSTNEQITIKQVLNFLLNKETKVSVTEEHLKKIEDNHKSLLKILEKNVPIYGVNTGFGDSCFRTISSEDSPILQNNLINYLMCGTGKVLPEDVSKAVSLIRTISLSRGISGVGKSLIETMINFINEDIHPVIPKEGSLGASGDLIPLAYLANIYRCSGEVFHGGKIQDAKEVTSKKEIAPYKFAPKEALAVVNGTSTMTAYALINYQKTLSLTNLATLCSSWLCIAIDGRLEAFGPLVNEVAKSHKGQAKAAKTIRNFLELEAHDQLDYHKIEKNDKSETKQMVQDHYSLRCSPQILGPIFDTLTSVKTWIEDELNSVSDNPLIETDGGLATGGNFYGGYLGHSMDYLKICLGNLADHMDRQLTLLICDRTNRGLPPNLANWNGDHKQNHLKHGLKGLHQCVNAITSEIMAKTIPNTIFSRSSEGHNQDKVSLGMSAASQCDEILDSLFNIFGCYLICLAQAIDLRKIELQGQTSQELYSLIRKHVNFVEEDIRLDQAINSIVNELKEISLKEGAFEL